MKKIALLIPAFLLTGCLQTIPKWPDVPTELLKACPDLQKAKDNDDKLSDLLITFTDNYKEYYDCKSKTDSWIEWYKGQQAIWKK